MHFHLNLAASSLQLLHLPHLQADETLLATHTGLAHVDGIVEPGVFAVHRGFELGSCAEIELGTAFAILTHTNEATVAHVDVDAIVGADAVNGFQLGAAMGIVLQLVVGSAGQNGAFHLGTFERASYNGDDETVAMRSLSYLVGAFAFHFQFDYKLQLGSFALCHRQKGKKA